MGQNKMEKAFREKLNQREIGPSAQAWDRLDAMLTVAEEKKPKRDLGWLYIAASIFGFLFVGAMYFSQTEEIVDIKRNEVVMQEQQSEQVETTVSASPSAPLHTESIAAVAHTESVPATSTVQHQRNNTNKPVDVVGQNQESALIAASSSAERDQKAASNSNKIINQKTEQVTNAEVGELLAQTEPVQKSETTKTSIKVNAQSLLSQVDGELNLSFREKMLRSIGKNYQEVAEAVSTRNIQQ